ncbi:MAG: hypothetical protein HY286_14500 [Planctomycetes bacterium]|nr:hypothetical protein [Planctomycetota bacterium]
MTAVLLFATLILVFGRIENSRRDYRISEAEFAGVSLEDLDSASDDNDNDDQEEPPPDSATLPKQDENDSGSRHAGIVNKCAVDHAPAFANITNQHAPGVFDTVQLFIIRTAVPKSEPNIDPDAPPVRRIVDEVLICNHGARSVPPPAVC